MAYMCTKKSWILAMLYCQMKGIIVQLTLITNICKEYAKMSVLKMSLKQVDCCLHWDQQTTLGLKWELGWWWRCSRWSSRMTLPLSVMEWRGVGLKPRLLDALGGATSHIRKRSRSLDLWNFSRRRRSWTGKFCPKNSEAGLVPQLGNRFEGENILSPQTRYLEAENEVQPS